MVENKKQHPDIELPGFEVLRILDSMQETYYRTDKEGFTLLVSKSAEQLLGYTLDEMIGTRMASHYMDDNGRAEFLKKLNECNGVINNYQAPLRHKNGHAVWVSTNARYYFDDNGDVLGVEGTTRNITEQKQTEDQNLQLQIQLERAQKMESIGQLAGGIAHDFNNILAIIMGHTELAKDKYATDPDSQLAVYLQTVIDTAVRGSKLIDKILAFGRYSPAVVEPVDGSLLIHEIQNYFSSILPSSLKLSIKQPGNCPLLSADVAQLHKVLTDLVINAQQATQNIGQIDIELHESRVIKGVCKSCHHKFDGEYIEISVSDNGSGISENVSKHLFEPFFTTRAIGEGTGLGLPMVAGIVHQCDGHIMVESNQDGGARFRLLFRPATTKIAVDEK